MRETLERKITAPKEAIKTKHSEKETSPEEELVEADLILEKAKTEVEEFVASGLPSAEIIATEMEDEIDLETKTALIELNKQAELARQMLADSFIGKLRLKSADFLKKHLPDFKLTKLAEQKNTDIISKRTADKLRELLKFEGSNYIDAEQAVDYFEKHKDLLAEEDRGVLESRVLEAKTFHEESHAKLMSEKTVEELQELMRCEDGNYKEAIEAVNYFEKHKDLIIGDEKQRQERYVFNTVEQYLLNIAGGAYTGGSWQNALSEYKKIPNDFIINQNIERIGSLIYSKMVNESIAPEEILTAFEGHLDLLAAGSKYQRRQDDFSSKDRVKIIKETYRKRGASKYIAAYKAPHFEDKDRKLILKPLFESYKVYDQEQILRQIDKMKNIYDLLPEEERNKLIKNLTERYADGVFYKLNQLNLNGEQKKILVEKLIQNKNYQCLQHEKDLKELGVSKNEIFNELLENDAINLFVHREDFNPSPTQYKLLLDSVTSNIADLEETLQRIYYTSAGVSKKLTEEELKIFQTIIDRNGSRLVFKYKNVFQERYKEIQNSYLKELPTNFPEWELEDFITDVMENLGGWEKNIERIRALVIEAGEQKVTNEYFEQLDKIGLKLPNRVMGKIKENIKKTEQRSLLAYFKIALQKNTTLEQIQREVQQKLENVTTQADYFKAVHLDVLKSVLKDRRFKTQFETHSSDGSLNPSYRAQQEEKMFNYVNNEMKGITVRPNYGYMSDNEHGIVGSFSEGSTYPSNINNYGYIHIKFKKEQMASRTTVTFDDSLGKADEIPPTPSIKPHFTSFELNDFVDNINRASNPDDWGSRYLEVQYHWPLRTSIIDSIHISEKNNLSRENVHEIEDMVKDYNEQNPNDKIKVITY